MRETFPTVFQIPFNSKNKWQLSIHKWKTKDEQSTTNPLLKTSVFDTIRDVKNSDKKIERMLFIKGAPEMVLAKCTHYINKKGVVKKIDKLYFIFIIFCLICV